MDVKFLNTCFRCGGDFYNPGEFKAHTRTCYGKPVGQVDHLPKALSPAVKAELGQSVEPEPKRVEDMDLPQLRKHAAEKGVPHAFVKGEKRLREELAEREAIPSAEDAAQVKVNREPDSVTPVADSAATESEDSNEQTGD